jgi:CBS domain-containing protein
MDSVSDIMTKKVVTCAPTDTILDVQRLLVNNHVTRVVVVNEKNESVGIITQKDIVGFLLVDKSRRGIEEIKVEEVMSKNLVTVKPDVAVSEVAKIMVGKKISSLVIVDDEGKLNGLVTKSDITAYFAHKAANVYKVDDFMSPNPIIVRPLHSMFLPISLMHEHRISRVVVVDDRNEPVGIITLSDVTMLVNLFKPAKVLTEGKPLLVRGFIALPKSIHLLTARDIMTANPISIEQDADLADAARLMARHNISGLPVTDDNGKIVGIITKSDITRATAALKEKT